MKIAVVGASGFVGATLVERLVAAGQHQVVPLIHSTGNAWRLARYGFELKSVDLLAQSDLLAGLEGCTHVVNCTRGPDEVMLDGLRLLLRACERLGVSRFVHLSSVAVYGDPPPNESVSEDAKPRPERGGYGWIKLQQDKMVAAACARGLPCVILCPPNISGAYSSFLLNVLSATQDGRFALVDGGESPCNLVDVRNLTHAIMLALRCEQADARRLFITDDEETTWTDLVQALAPLLPNRAEVASITRHEAMAMQPAPRPSRPSPMQTMRFVASDRIRSLLREDPLLGRVEAALRSAVTLLPRRALERLQMRLTGPIQVSKTNGQPRFDRALVKTQLRGVRHRCDRAKAVLGYAPEYSFAASMEVFRSWYETMYAYGGSGCLVKEL